MIITECLDLNEPMTLSPEEEKALDDLDHRPIVFDKDCMPLSEEYMKKILAEKRREAV